MTKRSWWRKPRKNDENDENDENIENVDDNEYHGNDYDNYNFDRRARDRSSRRRAYGSRSEDWVNRNEREFRPFKPRFSGDDFDSIFDRSPFGFESEFFSDFEREFSQMHERMDRLFHQAANGKLQPGEGGPFVYGFSMRTGPDGIPHVQEFGNVPPELRGRFREMNSRSLPFSGKSELRRAGACGSGAGTCTPAGEIPKPGFGNKTQDAYNRTRKPMTDVLECDDHISITMELPGVEKNDINLEIIDNELEVEVDSELRQYYNKIPLPAEVDPGSISASFKNGVLEVRVTRLKPKKKKGKKIKID